MNKRVPEIQRTPVDNPIFIDTVSHRINQFFNSNQWLLVNKANVSKSCATNCPPDKICGPKIMDSCPPGFKSKGFCCNGDRDMTFLYNTVVILRCSLDPVERLNLTKFTKSLNIDTDFEWEHISSDLSVRDVSMIGLSSDDCILLIRLSRKLSSLVTFSVTPDQFIQITNKMKNDSQLTRPSLMDKGYSMVASLEDAKSLMMNHSEEGLKRVEQFEKSSGTGLYRFSSSMRDILEDKYFTPDAQDSNLKLISVPVNKIHDSHSNFRVRNILSWNGSDWNGTLIPNLFNTGNVECTLNGSDTVEEDTVVRDVLKDFIVFLHKPSTPESMKIFLFDLRIEEVQGTFLTTIIADLTSSLNIAMNGYNGGINGFESFTIMKRGKGPENDETNDDIIESESYEVGVHRIVMRKNYLTITLR